ncbi:hypothetical protein C8R45DRAFT_1037974 [Mycena sanguinolenta]|nr:hypothetical protein C8R45DRAFT_1037974 [Mycena sanguinolenta]
MRQGRNTHKGDVNVFDTGEIVLAKIRGFPLWPGMVVDAETVPAAVEKERPRGKDVYAIRFFPVGDYAWFGSKELTRLTRAMIDAFVRDPTKKEGDLKDGYRQALDPAAWNPEVYGQKPRQRSAKSKAREEDEDDDELPGDETDADAEEVEIPTGTKKRKREEDVSATLTKPHNTANTEADPEALKVRKWRQKLQKTFLGNSTYTPQPTAELMPAVDALFKTVEGYRDMNVEYLTFSKISKVMRHIHRLDEIKVPRDDEFQFRKRANALIDKWDGILNSNPPRARDHEMEDGTVGEKASDLSAMDVTMYDG